MVCGACGFDWPAVLPDFRCYCCAASISWVSYSGQFHCAVIHYRFLRTYLLCAIIPPPTQFYAALHTPSLCNGGIARRIHTQNGQDTRQRNRLIFTEVLRRHLRANNFICHCKSIQCMQRSRPKRRQTCSKEI